MNIFRVEEFVYFNDNICVIVRDDIKLFFEEMLVLFVGIIMVYFYIEMGVDLYLENVN